MKLTVWLGLLLALLATVSGCAAPPGEAPVAQTPSSPPTRSADATLSAAVPEPAPAPVQASKYGWLDAQLTDAVSGKKFALADFKGRPVLLHPFAVW